MLFGERPREDRWIARVTPFLLGIASALACFAFLAWGLAHLWEPYSPPKPQSALMRHLRDVGWVFPVLDLFLRWRRRRNGRGKSGEGWWPVRHAHSPQAPESENSRAIETHPAEASRR